jgi:Protein of unknown function (DUF1302)
MAQRALSSWGWGCLSTTLVLGLAAAAHGAALDERGEINLGIRTYTAARIGTQDTDIQICYKDRPNRGDFTCAGSNGIGNVGDIRVSPTTGQASRSLTFPVSPAGHLRQNRFYLEAELDHNLLRLVNEGFGPLALLDYLPFKFRRFKYHLTFRGEYDGVYDYGPAEYRTHYQYGNQLLVPLSPNGSQANIPQARQRLRDVASHRERLFQAYLETQVEKLLIRFGRQILAWGETDVFRLLDNINPLDASFGGFLVPLDERRVPLDMLRLNYAIGELGPLYEMYVEAYAAIDDPVGFDPGIPVGSPWSLPNLGAPSATLVTFRTHPATVIKDTRGGFRINFNAPIPGIEEATFSIAHYYTYLDIPEVQTFVTPNFPAAFSSTPNGTANPRINRFQAVAIQTAPRVQITGASTTFVVPSSVSRMLMLSGEPVIRSELAYFAGEPRQSQAQTDPFIFSSQCGPGGRNLRTQPVGSFLLPGGGEVCTGGTRYGDSWNWVLGVDTNQFIHFLNPNQSFFITTQFFYKHLKGATKRQHIEGQAPEIFNGEVLPVPGVNIANTDIPGAGATQPNLIHQPVDQFLQTLLISTSYMSGQVSPNLTVAYDWSGSWLVQPQVTFSRDPFRFTFAYSYLEAGRLKGASGISLLRDRDNVLFQLEYVI